MAAQGSDGQRTIGQLVADAAHDLEAIVRAEIALAKAEILSGVQTIGKGAGLLIGAGVVALFGVFFLLYTLGRVIAIWLPISAAYGIVTVVLFLVAAVLALLGRNTLQEAQPAPEKAIEQAQQTVAVIKQPGHNGSSSAPSA